MNAKTETKATKPLNIHQRLAAAMDQVTYVRKDKNEKMQYSVVLHDAVTAKVRPALLSAGVVYYPEQLTHTQNGNRTEVSLSMRFVNIDNPDDFISVPSFGYGIDQQDKGPGKAISYAVKYALLKALGLETGDDPDKDQDVKHEPDETEKTVSDDQAANLDALIDEVQADRDAFLQYFKIEKLEEMKEANYVKAVKLLEGKRK